MFRTSGTPVDPVKAQAYQDEFRDGFDALREELGQFGPEFDKQLNAMEAKLLSKYNDQTVMDIDFPKTKKAWRDIVTNYGNITITTCAESNHLAKEGDILFVIDDMAF